MEEIRSRVEPQLPPRSPNKGEEKQFTLPAKPFKKDGTPSATMEKFLEKHGCTLEPLYDRVFQWIDGSLQSVEAGKVLPATLPMLMANQDQLKDWFLSLGWSPTLWNFKKDKRGKPERGENGQLIKTSPKIQETQKICPNLEAMEMPLVKDVVKWLSLRNRQSVVTGWMSNERLPIDSRLSAGSAGFANTHRQRHTVVVNLPKADPTVTLGKEVRALFVPSPGRVVVGYDAAALEARVEGHYTYRYDGGAYAKELLEGDVHYKNTFVFYDEELHALKLGFGDVDKDDPRFKPLRSKSKNGKYCLSYGGSAGKLASTLGVSRSRGEELYEAFWKANDSLGQLKTRLENFWLQEGGKKWIKGTDGRRIPTRSKHSLINTLFQSCGAVIMDHSAMYMNRWLGPVKWGVDGLPYYEYNGYYCSRVAYMHDEFVWETDPEISEEIGSLGVKSIIEAGKYLKLLVPLDGEAKIGKSWAEIH